MSSGDIFTTTPGFCNDCGSILPLLGEVGGVKCYTCEKEYSPSVFGKNRVEYTIHFNSVEATAKIQSDEKKRKQDEGSAAEGPVIDRMCPKCGNDKMSYATLQLRSADEGQTVFYTCTKCKYKENENS